MNGHSDYLGLQEEASEDFKVLLQFKIAVLSAPRVLDPKDIFCTSTLLKSLRERQDELLDIIGDFTQDSETDVLYEQIESLEEAAQ